MGMTAAKINYGPPPEQNLYSTQEALDYLQEKYRSKIKLATLYQQLHRAKVPRVSVEGRQYLRIQDIERLRFRVQLGNTKPKREPVPANTLRDLNALGKAHGTLVDQFQVLEIFQQRSGHAYTDNALRQRLYRGSLVPVCYSGKGRNKLYWFAKDEVMRVSLQPKRK